MRAWHWSILSVVVCCFLACSERNPTTADDTGPGTDTTSPGKEGGTTEDGPVVAEDKGPDDDGPVTPFDSQTDDLSLRQCYFDKRRGR